MHVPPGHWYKMKRDFYCRVILSSNQPSFPHHSTYRDAQAPYLCSLGGAARLSALTVLLLASHHSKVWLISTKAPWLAPSSQPGCFLCMGNVHSELVPCLVQPAGMSSDLGACYSCSLLKLEATSTSLLSRFFLSSWTCDPCGSFA